MGKVTCWTDPGGCSSCKHCGMGMDLDPYCAHPKVLARHPQGQPINAAIAKTCTPDLTLWEQQA